MRERRTVVVLLCLATTTAFIVLLAWATSSPPGLAVSATGPAATSSAPGAGSAAAGSTGSPDGSAPAGGSTESAHTAAAVTVSTAPEPFIQNFGPPAGTLLPPVESPIAAVPFPVGDGCDHSYGEPNQCVPVRFPPGVTDGCGWLRAHGFGPLAVRGPDRLGLDANRDGVACGPGDG